jgi:hypothetical protein
MYTDHAIIRCQQRGIRPEVVDALITFGNCRRHKGGDVYFMDQNARRRAKSVMCIQEYVKIADQLNRYVVMSDDGEIITVANRLLRLKFG